MVKIHSPVQSKNSDVRAGIKGLFHINGKDIRVFDNDRMIIMNLKKGESVAVFDKNNQPWELSRDSQGNFNYRKL